MILNWVAKDQTVLNYLLSNLSRDILGHVSTATTATEAWAAIEGMFASQSRARIISTRMTLAMASKGASTITEYFAKMKSLADDMASAERKLEDVELVSYILTRLDMDFNLVVSVVAARVEPISVQDLYTQLVSFESRMEIHGGGSQSSANMATKGGRGGGGNGSHQGCGSGRGGFGRRYKGGRSGGRGGAPSGVVCQLYGKDGHTVIKCFKRYDASFTGPP